MKMFPYIYEPDKSIAVNTATDKFLEENFAIKAKIQNLGWAYHQVGEIIPQTTENYWSGHYFPFNESWDELQVSCTQCCLGLYKQAFVSLRSGLELGLLSVYYNINDEGHKTVSDWYLSTDSSDSNTPRADKIWKILLSNDNIKNFNGKFNLRKRFDDLSYLHNYVHTKGYTYSNELGGIKGTNSQIFVAKALEMWLAGYEQIVILVATLHLLKYPLAVVEFDYFKKFGIDIPNFGGLETSKLQRIASILPLGFMEELKNIAANDKYAQSELSHIAAMPDKTEDEIEEQAIAIYKLSVEHGEGFIEWEKQQYKFLNDLIMLKPQLDYSDLKKITNERIEKIRAWATANNFMESKSKRLGWDKL